MLTNTFYVVLFSLSITASIIALIFSCVTIMTIILNRQCHNVTNLLICNTSGIVIIYSICHFSTAIYGLREDWALNQPACIFRGYFFLVLAVALCYSYSIQAISRLFFVVLYKYKRLLTCSTHWIIIILSWILSILFPIEPLFFQGAYIYETESRICLLTSQKFSTAIYSIITTFMIPFLIIGTAYMKILYTIRQSTRRIQPIVLSNQTDKTPKINRKREIKLAQNMLITLSCFTCGGVPYFILIILQSVSEYHPPDSFFLLSVISMSVFSSIVMFSVFYLNTQVRNIVKDFIFCQ